MKTLSASPGSVFDHAYGYDNVGNVTTIVDNTTAPIPNQSYTYDHRDRLTTWTLGSTTQQYTYNVLGNITSKPGNGVYTYPASGSARPHTPSAVNGAPYAYDPNGNLLTGGGRTSTWTIDNLPLSVSHVSGTKSYQYDADGEAHSCDRLDANAAEPISCCAPAMMIRCHIPHARSSATSCNGCGAAAL